MKLRRPFWVVKPGWSREGRKDRWEREAKWPKAKNVKLKSREEKKNERGEGGQLWNFA